MSKHTYFYSAPGPDNTVITFPVARVEGIRPGPHAVITAGLHGAEYPGIVATIRLFRELQPEQIRGSVTMIPIQNLEGFERRSIFTCPVDALNPNRAFPGDPEGSYTHRLTHILLEEFIATGDFHIDLHSGDLIEALVPFALCHVGEGTKAERLGLELAACSGVGHILQTGEDKSWSDLGTSYASAVKRGVPSAIVEFGGQGVLDEVSVCSHTNGLLNILRRFGVLDGEVRKRADGPRFYHDFVCVLAPQKGIFYSSVSLDIDVVQGQELGHLEDYFGNLICPIKATAAGRLLLETTSPAIPEGGLIFGIGAP